jgi:hypothetical protein
MLTKSSATSRTPRLPGARRLLATCGVLAASVAGVASLAAASPAAADSRGCASNVCMSLEGNGGGNDPIAAWAYATSFTGHFTVTGPDGYSVTSPTQYFPGGDGSAYWGTTIPAAADGTYCITGTDSAGDNEGTACESMSYRPAGCEGGGSARPTAFPVRNLRCGRTRTAS